jgi:hypothetical protein
MFNQNLRLGLSRQSNNKISNFLHNGGNHLQNVYVRKN